ncbi:MAG: hypothetical protein ACP5LM_00305 [Thermoplasmata archaeon]
MFDLADYLAKYERSVRKLIEEKKVEEAKKNLDEILRIITSSQFLDSEIDKLLVILNKLHEDYMIIEDYERAFVPLYLIYRYSGGKYPIVQDIKNFLKNLPLGFNVSTFESQINEIVGDNWEIKELMEILKKNFERIKRENVI